MPRSRKLPSVLPREFYDRDPALVARELLGKLLVRQTPMGLCGGPIVETEAYLAQDDSSCHSSRGRTRKNATMFGRPGLLYVYPIHARHCLNAVTEGEGVASAVLIRAIEPTLGLEGMMARRKVTKAEHVARGPARLCEALDVDRRLDGWDLTRGEEIWIAEDAATAFPLRIGVSPRIGVTSAHDLELRFYVLENRFVSGPRRRTW